MGRSIKAASLSLVAVVAFACAKPKPPDWVNRGSGSFPGDQGARIYGVGVADFSKSIAMTRLKCDNRARAELARVLNTYVATLMHDFMEEHRDFFNPETEGLDEFVSYIAKSVAEATLVGSQIIDRWDDEDKKVQYCLSVLNAESVLNSLRSKMREAIEEQHRAIVRERANEMLKKLDEELLKKR